MTTTPPTKQEAERALLQVGALMANAMYNLAQKSGHTLTEYDAAMLDDMRKQWDAARDAARAAQPAEPVEATGETLAKAEWTIRQIARLNAKQDSVGTAIFIAREYGQAPPAPAPVASEPAEAVDARDAALVEALGACAPYRHSLAKYAEINKGIAICREAIEVLRATPPPVASEPAPSTTPEVDRLDRISERMAQRRAAQQAAGEPASAPGEARLREAVEYYVQRAKQRSLASPDVGIEALAAPAQGEK